jgi:arginyl-tRNA synthetase
MNLAGLFHSYYNKHKVISDDAAMTAARLCFCRALKTVLRNGLRVVGLQAPETM